MLAWNRKLVGSLAGRLIITWMPCCSEAICVGVRAAMLCRTKGGSAGAAEKRGETVKAFVSLKAGVTVTPDELIAHCKERMAAYKYPRQVVVIDELPKTVTGKILRRELRGT